jgi:opacity protein-like surface antigen
MKTKITIGTFMTIAAFCSGTLSAQVPEAHKKNVANIVFESDAEAKSEDDRPPLRMFELGVRYLPSFSTLDLRTSSGAIVQGDVSLDHGYGAFIGVNFSRNIGVVAEVNYLDINQKYKDRDLNREISVSYLNIPVLFSLNSNKRNPVNLNLVVGPQIGVNVGSSIKRGADESSGTLRAEVGAKGTDVGWAYGAGLEFALDKLHNWRLDVGYRGYYGLFDVSTKQVNTSPDMYNIVVRSARKINAAYIGITACF